MGSEKRERQKANRLQKQVDQARVDQRRSLTRRVLIGVAVVAALFGLLLVLALAFGGDDDDDDNDVPPASTSATASTDAAATASSAAGTTPDDSTAAAAAASTPDDSAATADDGSLPTVSTGFGFGTGECAPEEVDEPVRDFDDAPRLCIDPAATYTATFVTSEGDIVVDLDAADQPGTVNNFVTLARYGYYDDTPIFRAEPSSGLFQGGGQDNQSSPGYTIPDEGTGYTYEPGTLAMARTSQPNSAGAQWFFTTDESAEYLADQGTYVVFGHITEGLDIAQAITALGDAGGVPTRDITLETVTITES